jgi:hypothetical protein
MIELGALTGGLVAIDPTTAKWSKDFHKASEFNHSFTEVCVYAGDGLPHFGTAAAFALFGFAAGDNRPHDETHRRTSTALPCHISTWSLASHWKFISE